MKSQKKNRPIPPYVWTFTTYFTEGFPYTIIRTISSVFFRDLGVGLEAIGLTSLYGLPWIIKFLWAPQVDEFGSKRKWLLLSQGVLSGLFVAVALAAPLPTAVRIIAVLFFAGSFVAATHDIAIDGYYMEALDKKGQARFIGYRVMAYRIAMMTGAGVIVTIGTTAGWFRGFMTAALLMIALFIFHLLYLPRCEEEKKPLSGLTALLRKPRVISTAALSVSAAAALHLFFRSTLYQGLQHDFPFLKRLSFAGMTGILLFAALVLLGIFRHRLKNRILSNSGTFYARTFISFMDRKGIGLVLAFIILIRTGEFMLSAMVGPFMVDLGIKVHYGWISGAVGLPCSIAGAMLGGWLIARYSLKKMIWPFLLAQNLTNLIYMLLALRLSGFLALNTGNPEPVSIGTANLLTVAAVQGFDQFAGGLGTAILMTYLMRICRSDHKAAHYAIGTGLMSVSGLYAGVLSGFIASQAGYGYFFGISFLMSIPGMALVFRVPLFEPEKG